MLENPALFACAYLEGTNRRYVQNMHMRLNMIPDSNACTNTPALTAIWKCQYKKLILIIKKFKI